MTRTTTIKVPTETHARLLEIASEDDQTMGEIVAQLVKKYDRERFWQKVAEDLERFKADKAAYQQYMDEFHEWDAFTTESLANEPPYFTDGEEI